MTRNYVRKDPGVWCRSPVERLPHAPATDRYMLIKDEQGRLLLIDEDLDYLFRRDERMTRRVWTEDGVTYTEVYETGYNSREEQHPRKRALAVFVWEAWNINPLPRSMTLAHENGNEQDFRVRNLVPERKKKSEVA